MRIPRVTASLSGVVADRVRRTITGTVCRYGGEIGHTTAGPLAVSADLTPPPLGLPVTLEHDRSVVRGHVALVDNNRERLRVAVRVVDGALGDAALAEAADRGPNGRGALSLDLVDVEVVDGVMVSGTWAAIGQVRDPAFNSARIDHVAASTTHQEDTTMTPEQIARLAELRAKTDLTDEERAELEALEALESAQAAAANQDPAPAAQASATAVAASATGAPAVPAGVPGPAGTVQVRESGAAALRRMITEVTAALGSSNRVAGITAALADITHTNHTAHIEEFAWSGELWSGLEYVPEWSDLLAHDTLTHWEGKGWRFTSKLEMDDYAGDKTEIPTDNVTTEPSGYEAARMALGIDVDRKFYDFPNAAFVQALLEQIRESWEIKLDGKARAYITTKAVAATRTATVATTNGDATVTAPAGTFSPSDVGTTIAGAGIPDGATIAAVTTSGEVELSAPATATGAAVVATLAHQHATLLKAAARASQVLKRRRVGKADWIVVNDEDYFTLLDYAEKDLPALLKLWGITPEDFRSSDQIAPGTLLAGVRKTAKLRTLPGSPIRIDAQNLAHGGVDNAAFGYWAIEEHHKSGIASVRFRKTA